MPPVPAVTIHSHVPIDALPLHLVAETYLLVQRCSVSATSENSQRYKDLVGNCFLRVDTDQRLQFTLEYFIPQNLGLADFYPGRDLSDGPLTFANGAAQRHQFAGGGVFIYESANDDDPAGELRRGTCVISYDLHTGRDGATYPAPPDGLVYADVPAQAAPTAFSPSARTMLLEDVFYGENNFDSTFTISAYNGAPSGAGVLLGTVTLRQTGTPSGDSWIPGAIVGGDRYNWEASPPFSVQLPATGSARTCTHLRILAGPNVVCDITLDAALSVPAGSILRIPAASLRVSLRYFWGLTGDGSLAPLSNNEDAARWLIQYALGGTRDHYMPSSAMVCELYNGDPATFPGILPVESFSVVAPTGQWIVTGATAAPAVVMTSPTAAAVAYSYNVCIIRIGSTLCRAISRNVSGYVNAGDTYSSLTDASIDTSAS